MSSIPKGRWNWFGTPDRLYLATDHSGRQVIMDFARMGLQSAQPRFQVAGRMVPASDLVKFEVGDGKATGFAEGRADEAVYRLDVSAIDHPIARAIVALPELIAACEAALDRIEEDERDADERCEEGDTLRTVLAKVGRTRKP